MVKKSVLTKGTEEKKEPLVVAKKSKIKAQVDNTQEAEETDDGVDKEPLAAIKPKGQKSGGMLSKKILEALKKGG